MDFSFAVHRFLKEIKPDVAALVELEVWPNFTAACAAWGIQVCVVNGRLTERSMRRYRMVSGLIRRSFQRLSVIGAQNETYAQRFRALGVPAERVRVTGNLKWDTAQIADETPGADELARALGIDRTKRLIVAGSTAPGEHELLIEATPPGVQLLCAPRRPEWFDLAAAAMPGCVRRSQRNGPAGANETSSRFLLDTIGELRQAYALADVVVVGRSFGKLHGSDMMEPIALGKPTIVGPAFSDFQETMEALLAADGVIQTTSENLAATLRDLLASPQRRHTLAENGRAVIRAHQGATDRTADLILTQLRSRTD